MRGDRNRRSSRPAFIIIGGMAMNDRQTVRSDKRKPWEEPEIVLERSLEVAAQGGGPPGQLQWWTARRFPRAVGPVSRRQSSRTMRVRRRNIRLCGASLALLSSPARHPGLPARRRKMSTLRLNSRRGRWSLVLAILIILVTAAVVFAITVGGVTSQWSNGSPASGASWPIARVHACERREVGTNGRASAVRPMA